ncbi:hypothetical protein GCM10022197_22070 [Microlunatus spumicola]|uniref:Uncharacterized protein n=1 Tax=Microlunatus spumicola TaxID=81499 RepID=A0ABP6XGK8_9ACTN
MTKTAKRRPGGSGGYRASGSYAAAFQAWLRRRCSIQAEGDGSPIDKMRPIRTSSETVTLWLASARTSFAAADHKDPDVAQAFALGFDVVRSDAIGVTTRADLGDSVFEVRMHHAPGGIGARRLGVVLHIGNTFFVYLLSSARANNLHAESEDRRGNAATEILSGVVRAMYNFGKKDPGYRPHVHCREHDRIVRDERHGADLKATFVSCRVIAHTPHTTDLTQPASAQSFSFGSMLSSGSAEAAIRGMNRSEIVLQAGGGYYEPIWTVPFTHGPRVLIERDTRTGVEVTTTDKHLLAVTDDEAAARALLRRLVDKILEPREGEHRGQEFADWAGVGDVMAECGLPSRLPEHLKKNILLRDLPSASRAGAARTLFSSRWISGWQHGHFEKLVPIKIAMELDLTDLGVEETLTPDGRPAYRCQITMPLPEGGWGITDEEWQRVLDRRYPLSDKPRRYSGMVMPFAGLAAWTDQTASQQCMVATKMPLYSVRSRSLAEAVHGDGRPRGWSGSETKQLAVVRAGDLHADVARAMREALLGLDAEVQPAVLAPRTSQSSDVAQAAAAEVSLGALRAELAEQVERAADQVDGAIDERNEVKGRHAKENSVESAALLQEAERALARARVRLANLEAALVAAEGPTSASPPIPVDELADVQTATAEFVAAALEKCVASAPGWLQEACRQLLHDLQLVPCRLPGSRPRVAWSASLVLNVVGEEPRQVTLPISGQILDRTNTRAGQPVSSGPEIWSWAYFYQGRSYAEIGAAEAIDGSGKKNSYLHKGMTTWLTPAVPEPDLRAAALDCPVPATRRALYSAVTGDGTVLAGINEGFAAHIVATYAGKAQRRRWGWCGDTHQLARHAAQFLVAAGGTAPVHEIAQALGAPAELLVPLARVNGTSTRGGRAAHPAPAAISPFTKSWSRGPRWLSADERTLSLRPCRHDDCPERLRGETPFASHVLAVPETEAGFGVLCPHCRRLPVLELRRVYFPTDYLRPWSGRFGQGSHDGARRQAGTHLDVVFLDPGPSAPLPETGAAPRPEAPANRKAA